MRTRTLMWAAAACLPVAHGCSPAERTVTTPSGLTVGYTATGNGPPLVLVHGSFSDHHSNWELVIPALARHHTVLAMARRGRGRTAATRDHTVDDEAADLASLLLTLDERAVVVGHSYGAAVALQGTLLAPDRVARLVLYEPPRPDLVTPSAHQALAAAAQAGDWDGLALRFFAGVLMVPGIELAALRNSEAWGPIVADAAASWQDARALSAWRPDRDAWRTLRCPVLLQVGEHSPRSAWLTDALAAALPDARIDTLAGQAHEAATTAPDVWLASVLRFVTR